MKIEYVVLNDSLELQPPASLNRTLVLVEPPADATSKPIKAVRLRNSNLLSRTQSA
jgi:hypothetical protein